VHTPPFLYLCPALDFAHVDTLVGGCTTAVARQQPPDNNRGMVFSARTTKQQLNSKRGTVFSVRSMPRCYNKDKYKFQLVEWNELVGG
jgi:hypothetical protein